MYCPHCLSSVRLIKKITILVLCFRLTSILYSLTPDEVEQCLCDNAYSGLSCEVCPVYFDVNCLWCAPQNSWETADELVVNFIVTRPSISCNTFSTEDDHREINKSLPGRPLCVKMLLSLLPIVLFQSCAVGYSRTNLSSQGYLGNCMKCNCYSHSASCDPESGICLDCRHFTAGKH